MRRNNKGIKGRKQLNDSSYLSNFLKKGYKSDSNKNINERKKRKKNELSLQSTLFKADSCQKFSDSEYNMKQRKNKRQIKYPKIFYDFTYSPEFHMKTRSMDRKQNNFDDVKIIEIIELSDNSKSSKKKTSKKNKNITIDIPQNININDCKNIKTEFLDEENDEIMKNNINSFYSIKQEENNEDNIIIINKMQIKNILSDVNDNIKKRGRKKKVSKSKINSKNKSKKKIIQKSFDNEESLNKVKKGKKKEINKYKNKEMNEIKKIEKFCIKNNNIKRSKTKDNIKKDSNKKDKIKNRHNSEEKINPSIKKGKPEKSQKKIKIDHKIKIIKQYIDNDNDDEIGYIKKESQKQSIIVKNKKNMKNKININNYKNIKTDSYSNNFINYKSKEKIQSYKIKTINTESLAKLADNYYFSFLEEKKNPSPIIILKKIPINEINTNNMITKNVEIKINKKKNIIDSNIDLLGHKRKRRVKKEDLAENNESKKCIPQIKNDEFDEFDINIKESKKVKSQGKKNHSLNTKKKINNNNKENLKKENLKSRNYSKNKKSTNRRNTRGTKKNDLPVKRKPNRKKKSNDYECDDGLKSIRSKSADENIDNNYNSNDSDDFFDLWYNEKLAKDIFNKGNNLQSLAKEYKEDLLFPNTNPYDKIKYENNNETKNKNNIINHFNITKKSISKSDESYKSHISDNLPEFDSPFKKINFQTSEPIENTNLNFSFSLDTETTIQLKDDPTFFFKNSGYIKYCPIDQFIPQVPEKDRQPITARIGKKTKLNSFDFTNFEFEDVEINSDTDLISLATYDGNNILSSPDDLIPILTIPRIKPLKEEHSRVIKEKLEKDGIPIVQTDNEVIKKEEKKYFAGSFVLHDKKNDIKVNVPVFRDSEYVKKWLEKKNLKIIDFEEDNDIETDEEQLKLEIERNNEALLYFCKKVEEDPNYIDNHLKRKRK